eukprot:GEMP01002651.1.p1 GENE.GEMP01002651.1~~GEMP01002651.1.p1  ORF type:complete len:366 (-),score=104.87 GEMP01002651.1:3653-4678(-)
MLTGTTTGPAHHDISSPGTSSPQAEERRSSGDVLEDLDMGDEFSQFDRNVPQAAQDAAEEGAFSQGLKSAFPMDKIAKGGEAAKGFFAWGFGKVKEEAQKVEKAVAESDFGKSVISEVERVKDSEAVRISRHVTTSTLEKVQYGVQEVSEIVSNVIDPALEGAMNKTSEVADQMKPHLEVAKEQTKTGIQRLGSVALKTAIWFQSMGSTGFDSDDEDGSPATQQRSTLSHDDPIVPKPASMHVPSTQRATASVPVPPSIIPPPAQAMSGIPAAAPAVVAGAATSGATGAAATVAAVVPAAGVPAVSAVSAAPVAEAPAAPAPAGVPAKTTEDDLFDFDLLG